MNTRARFYENNSKLMIEISIVGDPNIFVGKVRDEHKAQFPKEWAEFEKGQKPAAPKGTPLEEVKGVGPKMANKLRSEGVHTAEELAELGDGNLGAIGMGAHGIRRAARELVGYVNEVSLVG